MGLGGAGHFSYKVNSGWTYDADSDLPNKRLSDPDI